MYFTNYENISKNKFILRESLKNYLATLDLNNVDKVTDILIKNNNLKDIESLWNEFYKKF
ncbi:hypothetical protein [Aliarcobacter skirrowii]|uniref:Uncharacterized protein n=1 Tax=Aliarcobacter skirrowii TaxID=28200 RepID=A0AAW9DAR9_9BACT|nr:hypothetical protein [Aliarcobacter skirrowii]MDX4069231.1 hypothetical protein [Aliarcobacter skirrowii]